MSRLHYYLNADIPDTIYPAFANMKRDGQEVYELPYHTSLFSNIQPMGVEPARMKIDFRSEVRKTEDLLGKSS